MVLAYLSIREHRIRRSGFGAAALIVAGCLACNGGGGGGGATAAPTPVPVASISPLSATVVVGQTLQFSASAASTITVTWSVSPAAGGTFSASGLFTAGSGPGAYQVSAAWTQADGTAAVATTQVSVVAAPQTAMVNPNLESASGGDQKSASGTLQNLNVMGENVKAKTSTSTSGTLQNRPGLDPAVTTTGQ